MISWPGTIGNFGCVSSPSTTCRSVRQTAQAATATSTCPGPGSGRGSAREARPWPGASSTIARIEAPPVLSSIVQRLPRPPQTRLIEPRAIGNAPLPALRPIGADSGPL